MLGSRVDITELIDWDEFEFAVFVDNDPSAIEDLKKDIEAIQSIQVRKFRFLRKVYAE